MDCWGTPPWVTRPRIPPRSPPKSCDIAVVGGGFTGLAAALALAKRGAAVALFEAGRIGAGASGRTGGIALEGAVSGTLGDPDPCLPQLERLIGEQDIECDLRLSGCLELVHCERGSRRALWCDGETDLCIDERVPGGTIDPGALVAGLADAAARAGAQLFEAQPVRRLASGPTLELDSGRVRAAGVLLALNSYLQTFLPQLALRPALTLALCTAPQHRDVFAAIGLPQQLPFYTVDQPFVWGRSLRDGRLVFGGGWAMNEEDDLGSIDVARGNAAAQLERLEARVRGFHPALEKVRVERRWGGPVATLGRRPPVLAFQPGADAVLIAGGYAGHGVALSLHAGQLAAGALLGESAPPPWGALESRRPD